MVNNSVSEIAIVGTGFAGLAAAVRLREAGFDDLVLLERAGDVGGTWRDNTYPGAACDVPSHLYSLSFAPNPGWSRSFSPQAEIQAYLRTVAADRGITPLVRFDHDVRELAWDEEDQRWRILTQHGEHRARHLVLGTGALSQPATPNLPGLEDFRGTVFHSARWDHGHDLGGRRVAVIGTGASAIQFVPQIQPRVAALTLFQRTPPWVMPRLDRRLTAAERWLYRRLPGAQQLARGGIHASRELVGLGLTKRPALLRSLEAIGRLHLRRHVPDPVLRAKLTPGYAVGCKRILISNDYYPALSQPNVQVETGGVAWVGPTWVETHDGTRHEVDTIIFGTGFHVTDNPVARHVHGRGGTSLADTWTAGMSAHLGTTIAGFPNLWFLVGPNTGTGHISQVFMIESQVAYVVAALSHLRTRGDHVIEVRESVQRAYDAHVQRLMQPTVWVAGGCSSWYLDEHGRNSTLWPDFAWRFRGRTRRFDAGSYVTGNGRDVRHSEPATAAAR